jgi:hypothetical protein
MSTTDQRPDPSSVSHEPVATIATQRAGQLFQDVILRDAKIQEQQQYITTLENRITELETQAASNSQPQTARGPADS